LPQPLGLQLRPAPRIVRGLHPRPKSYRVALCFHAGRLYLLLSDGVRRRKRENKKAVRTDPG
jgi:hypothetical protein